MGFRYFTCGWFRRQFSAATADTFQGQCRSDRATLKTDRRLAIKFERSFQHALPPQVAFYGPASLRVEGALETLDPDVGLWGHLGTTDDRNVMAPSRTALGQTSERGEGWSVAQRIEHRKHSGSRTAGTKFK